MSPTPVSHDLLLKPHATCGCHNGSLMFASIIWRNRPNLSYAYKADPHQTDTFVLTDATDRCGSASAWSVSKVSNSPISNSSCSTACASFYEDRPDWASRGTALHRELLDLQGCRHK